MKKYLLWLVGAGALYLLLKKNNSAKKNIVINIDKALRIY